MSEQNTQNSALGYTATKWFNGQTPLSAENLNKIEEELVDINRSLADLAQHIDNVDKHTVLIDSENKKLTSITVQQYIDTKIDNAKDHAENYTDALHDDLYSSEPNIDEYNLNTLNSNKLDKSTHNEHLSKLIEVLNNNVDKLITYLGSGTNPDADHEDVNIDSSLDKKLKKLADLITPNYSVPE